MLRNSPSARGTAQCTVNPAQVSRLVGVTNTWLVDVTIYCTVPVFSNNSPPALQFLHEKLLTKKKEPGKMLID